MMDLFYTIDKDGSGELVRVQQLVLSLPIAAFPRCADCVVFSAGRSLTKLSLPLAAFPRC